VGFIDRHNYSGTPLNRPGVGSMSAAFQQVKDRPFNFSEWGGGDIGVPTVAVYGLGLQGWDASCQFSSKAPVILDRMGRGVNSCCDDFIQVGQWPALARMTHRGDVQEGDIVANRRVSIPALKEKADVGFSEHFSLLGGGANTKEFSSVVPSAALAAGRVVLDYIDGPVPDQPVTENVGQYIDEKNKVVRSTTGQLLWDYSGRGHYTIDTPGTQGVVGYVGGKTLEFGDVTLAPVGTAPFKIYVTSLEREKGIADASRLLVTAFARDANTGMVFDEFSDRPLENGDAPLLMEPVRMAVTLKGRKVKAVTPLSHAGRIPEKAVPVKVEGAGQGTRFTLDGRQTKTMYYLLEMD
jgi:hypothetical protein